MTKKRSHENGDEVFDDIKDAIKSQKHWDAQAIKQEVNLKHKILKMKGKFVVRSFSI